MQLIEHLVGTLAASPWALVAMAVVLIVDGFFPFVPGETLVVAVAASAATGGHDPLIVLAVAVPAALAGDLIAYHLGRRAGLERWSWLRRPRVAASLEQTTRRLEQNPASILLTAKFVPVVRVLATMTAGAGRMPLRRYLPLAVASVSLYTGFHVAIGTLVGTAAGSLLGNPLVALAVSVVAGALLGVIVDRVGSAVRRVRETPVQSRLEGNVHSVIG